LPESLPQDTKSAAITTQASMNLRMRDDSKPISRMISW